MAEKKAQEPVKTTYVTEQAPNLPDANVSATREDAVIDTRLIEIRDAEAQKNAKAAK